MESYDVIIIGAGLSGLAAGIRLSQYGKRVRIVDRQRFAGGMNSYFYRGGRCYDIGLHAMTNLANPNDHSAPLNTLLRQLRIRREELELCPQKRSCVKFPDAILWFDNDFETLRESVRQNFPRSMDGFDRLAKMIRDDDCFNPSLGYLSARKILAEVIPDEELREMLLCPVMFYGSCWVDDMDFHQFCIVFRSIFFEGLCRPAYGMERFIAAFTRRLEENGVELSMGTTVQAIRLGNGIVSSVLLDNGEELSTRNVLSCAGWPETMSLLPLPSLEPPRHGALAYTETLFELDAPASELGMAESIIFINNHSCFRYRPPEDGSIDMASYLLCTPDNFQGVHEMDAGPIIRMSHLANYNYWKSLEKSAYQAEKERIMDRQQAILEATYPNFNAHVKRREMFSPLTLERYTGRVGGSIYGSPDKRKDGRTFIPNLYLCGSDQGYLGIVGSLLSGVVIANRYMLR